jgi:large subunit ribosomal protein L11
MGINLGKVISDVNTATSGFKGMNVPVEIDVDGKTKSFTIKVFSPSVAELLKKEIVSEKGSGSAKEVKVGNLAIEQVISVAKTKHPALLARTLKSAVKLVTGTCVALGILIESKDPKQIEKDIEISKENIKTELLKQLQGLEKLSEKDYQKIETKVNEQIEKAITGKSSQGCNHIHSYSGGRRSQDAENHHHILGWVYQNDRFKGWTHQKGILRESKRDKHSNTTELSRLIRSKKCFLNLITLACRLKSRCLRFQLPHRHNHN